MIHDANMPPGAFVGEPGTAWTNDTGKILYQFHCEFDRSCGRCINQANRIGPWWPIPLHPGCSCVNIPIPPGHTAAPFLDFVEEMEKLSPTRRTIAIGAANWKLIRAGLADWTDVVTRGQIRDFRQVVGMKKLTAAQMQAAGIPAHHAQAALEALAGSGYAAQKAAAQAAVAKLQALGMSPETIKGAVKLQIKAKFTAIAGPSGSAPLAKGLAGAVKPVAGGAPTPSGPAPLDALLKKVKAQGHFQPADYKTYLALTGTPTPKGGDGAIKAKAALLKAAGLETEAALLLARYKAKKNTKQALKAAAAKAGKSLTPGEIEAAAKAAADKAKARVEAKAARRAAALAKAEARAEKAAAAKAQAEAEAQAKAQAAAKRAAEKAAKAKARAEAKAKAAEEAAAKARAEAKAQKAAERAQKAAEKAAARKAKAEAEAAQKAAEAAQTPIARLLAKVKAKGDFSAADYQKYVKLSGLTPKGGDGAVKAKAQLLSEAGLEVEAKALLAHYKAAKNTKQALKAQAAKGAPLAPEEIEAKAAEAAAVAKARVLAKAGKATPAPPGPAPGVAPGATEPRPKAKPAPPPAPAEAKPTPAGLRAAVVAKVKAEGATEQEDVHRYAKALGIDLEADPDGYGKVKLKLYQEAGLPIPDYLEKYLPGGAAPKAKPGPAQSIAALPAHHPDSFQGIKPEEIDPTWALLPSEQHHNVPSYGGVLFDDSGGELKILLREPSGHFGGYAWTFPKGKLQPEFKDNVAKSALAEVAEETGHKGEIVGALPGAYKGTGSTATRFFVMKSGGYDASLMDTETSAVRWATLDEAKALIAQTPNQAGRERDLKILEAAFAHYPKLLNGEAHLGHLAEAQAAAKAKADAEAQAAAEAAAKAAQKAAEAAALKAAARAASRPKQLPPPPPPDTAHFPASIDDLKVGKRLGGGTGAYLATDAQGRKFVYKEGSNEAHLKEEAIADAMYHAMGVKVPAYKTYQHKGKTVKVTQFLEGAEPIGSLKASDPRRQKAEDQLRRSFAADALMGNWDVLGASNDNVFVDKDGNAVRIDNGGSLRFRAMGAKKEGTQWNPYPTELWTMRAPGSGAQGNAHAVFGKMQFAGVLDSIADILPREDAALKAAPPELHATISARFDQMRDVLERGRTMLADQFVDGYTDAHHKHMMGIREAGMTDRMAESFKRKGPSSTTPVDQDGKEWDHLRGPDAIVQRLADYIKANGGNYDIARKWMSDQAGNSWNEGPQALKHFLYLARGKADPGEHYWAAGFDHSKKIYEKTVEKYGEETYRNTISAVHAFTQEYLHKMDFPGKDAEAGTVRLIRTEDIKVMQMQNKKVGEVSPLKRGLAESFSVWKECFIGTTEVTVQHMPITRVIATYWQARSPTEKDHGAFLGDGENEFVCCPDNIPMKYTGKAGSSYKDPY